MSLIKYEMVKIKPMELVVDEEISLKIEVESPEVGQQKSKKGRKPKHLALKTGETKQEKKRRAQHSGEDMNAHLNRVYCNWMKRQGKGNARPTNKVGIEKGKLMRISFRRRMSSATV